jgi:predicted AAA+ superfamily ATPase
VYITRAIEEKIIELSNHFRVVLLTGPRQCGKTTLLKKLADSGRGYVTLDDLTERRLARTDPALFVELHKPPVLIDEIQYAPDILSYIKIKVDQNEGNGAYWLTGSQTFRAMRNITETLAGRVGVVQMQGLSRSEILGYPSEPFRPAHERLRGREKVAPPADVHEVFRLIQRGGMPALHADTALPAEDYYSSYLTTYLERDIRDLTQVADEMTFLRFLTVCAGRTARPLIMEEIARDTGVNASTVKRWISILVTSGVATLLPAYHKNVLKRAIKTPLLHFLDTGLCAHILRWTTPEVLEKGAMSGQFFESWVFSEVYKSYINRGIRPPFYYYRDKEKNEIDLLIEKDGVLHPVEIKKTASPGHNDVRNFKKLDPVYELEGQHKTEIGEGAVLCMIDHLMPDTAKNWFVPAWLV